MKNLCFGCGGLKRPELFLKPTEAAELDRLLELGDWRAWAKKVLELSDPRTQKAREILDKAIDGATPEELRKLNEELADAMIAGGFPE